MEKERERERDGERERERERKREKERGMERERYREREKEREGWRDRETERDRERERESLLLTTIRILYYHFGIFLIKDSGTWAFLSFPKKSFLPVVLTLNAGIKSTNPDLALTSLGNTLVHVCHSLPRCIKIY